MDRIRYMVHTSDGHRSATSIYLCFRSAQIQIFCPSPVCIDQLVVVAVVCSLFSIFTCFMLFIPNPILYDHLSFSKNTGRPSWFWRYSSVTKPQRVSIEMINLRSSKQKPLDYGELIRSDSRDTSCHLNTDQQTAHPSAYGYRLTQALSSPSRPADNLNNPALSNSVSHRSVLVCDSFSPDMIINAMISRFAHRQSKNA